MKLKSYFVKGPKTLIYLLKPLYFFVKGSGLRGQLASKVLLQGSVDATASAASRRGGAGSFPCVWEGMDFAQNRRTIHAEFDNTTVSLQNGRCSHYRRMAGSYFSCCADLTGWA